VTERKAAKSGKAEVLAVAGCEITISHPDKVLFPQPKHTKLDLARYYIVVAEGALRGAGGRPNMLVRYPDGIEGEHFYQKRAPKTRPPWIEVAQLRFPSGRVAEEVVPRGAPALVWLANLACLELHPHPVRAEDLDHPDELRVRPKPDARVSAPLSWDEVEDCDPADFTLASMPARFKKLGDRHAAIDKHPGSLQGLLELFERQGLGDAPWPPHYKKTASEPARVQPARRKRP